jgi:RHS repeat-associated protein
MAYDAAGTETGITDSLGNNLWAGTYSYGVAPFLLTATDKDLGAWAYTHNALGELTAWSDANKHSFSETYDVLSRPLTRVEPDLFTQWTWGASAANHNIGKLQSVCTGTGGSCSSSDYSESETYDSLGRQSQRTIAIPVAQGTFTYTWSYNATTGLLDALTYPVSTSGYALKLKYGYLYGVLQSVTDVSDSPNVTFWTANTMNPRSQITQATFGNGVVIKRSFDAVTGWVGNVQAGKGGGAALQNQSYLFDDVGNLTQRQDNNRGLSENVYYDNVYRFGHSTLNGTINLAVTYDSMGDVLTTQSEGGAVTTRNYTAPQAGCTGNSQLHAVRQTVQGSTTQSFCYDSNGNTTTTKVNGTLFGTSSWTSYNQPSAISGGTSSSSFLYDANHQRWQQTARYAGTTETTDYIGGLMERVVVPSGIAFRHYVPVGNDTVIYTRWSTGSAPTYYVTADHLGSAAVITDSSGNLVLNENFAAPGWRRGDNWTGKPTTAELTTIDSITHRGFTGQEMLDNLSLTDMNGRVYTNLGTFLSPDPFISNPRNTQSYNRYAYVNNNALSYTDPTGFFNFWDLLNPFSNDNPLNPFGRVGREIALAPFDPSIGNDLLRKNPWLQTIGEIAACYWGQAWGCSAASAYLTRLNGGSLLQSAEAGFFAYTLYDGIAPDATSWYGRAFERAVVEGGIVGAMGGDYTRGFEFAFAGSALNDWYTGTVGHNADWSPGENQVAYNVPCGDPGSNCYEALSKGQIPQDWWTKNTWGNNEYLQGNGTLTDCFTQSGPCSRVADQVPGMQALSQLHDTWLNPGGILPHWLNFPSMPFAAGITYGALIGDSIFNFTPWLKITTPGWASSSSWLGVPPATAGYGH